VIAVKLERQYGLPVCIAPVLLNGVRKSVAHFFQCDCDIIVSMRSRHETRLEWRWREINPPLERCVKEATK
jgi:hypothetical protein